MLICTELISRGIDFLGVNLVVNYDFPSSAISYIHRIGRTGRAGRKGKAVTYFTQDDKQKLRSIANIMQNSGCKVPEYMLTIKKASKKVRRQLEKTVPKREDIAVSRPNQMNKKRKLTKNGNDENGTEPPSKKKKKQQKVSPVKSTTTKKSTTAKPNKLTKKKKKNAVN